MDGVDNPRLQAALKYASRSWFVFPCHTPGADGTCSCRHRDCQDTGKHPRTMNGFKDASVDEGQIRKWWGMWPDANVGIACGPSGLHVLDIDPRHGGDESLADLRMKHGEEWLATCIVQTGGGGTHYYYRAATPPLRNRAGVLPGIDVRGDGGYVVAPPSLHASGGVYAWEVTANETAPAEWPTGIVGGGEKGQRAPAAVIGDTINAGERNSVLTSLAGTMRRRGMSEGAIFEALRAENRQRCQPPLAESEIRTIAHSVGAMAPANDILLRIKSGAPMYSALRKHTVDPPVWVLRIGETDIRLNIEELSNHQSLRKAAIAQANIVLPRMKAPEWDDQLSVLMSNMEIVDAPADASEAGIIWDALRAWIDRYAEQDEERFGEGRPILRDGHVITTGAHLRQALMQGPTPIRLTQPQLWAIAVAHGATRRNVRVGKRQQWIWEIPWTEEVLEDGNDL